jgi:hypothetical protein
VVWSIPPFGGYPDCGKTLDGLDIYELICQ